MTTASLHLEREVINRANTALRQLIEDYLLANPQYLDPSRFGMVYNAPERLIGYERREGVVAAIAAAFVRLGEPGDPVDVVKGFVVELRVTGEIQA